MRDLLINQKELWYFIYYYRLGKINVESINKWKDIVLRYYSFNVV